MTDNSGTLRNETDTSISNITIIQPTHSQTYTDFQYSVHTSPRSLLRELKSVFPGAKLDTSTIYVVPTFQKSSVPLLQYGDVQAAEKDRLLERFFEWSQLVLDAIKVIEPGAWADATDPASGMAWKGASGSCYSDVDGLIRLLKYDTMDIGGCRVAVHPQWRFSVYPATFFTNASDQTILQALTQVNSATKKTA